MSQILPDDLNLLLRWFISYGMLLARYLVFAGFAFLLFYILMRRKWFFMKIQQKFPRREQILTEIKYSLLSFAVFAAMGVLIRFLSNSGYVETKIYKVLSEHSLAWYVFSTVLLIFVHDTYFYWAHRLMHHPLLYERVHKVHHLSKDPTPWAAFAFHPIEAFIEIAFVPVLIFTIPFHFSSFLILALWQITFNVLGHLGYEFFPKGYTKHWLFKWSNTSTNHNMHHKYVNCNYGLYFSLWDRLMNTTHKKYHQVFDEVAGRKADDVSLPEGSLPAERPLEVEPA